MKAALLFGLLFLVLAAANSSGYRYGISDQAFYIPSIHRHLDPALFPRDRALLDEQARLFWLDDAAAWLQSHTGVSVPVMFLVGFAATGVLLGGALWALARGLGLAPITGATFVLAMTLRHRIAETGVNTFEGYFHPRVLAFAVGIAAIALLARQRAPAAALLLIPAFLVHPTTAIWFAGWFVVALVAIHFARQPATAHGHMSRASGITLGAAVIGAVLLLVFVAARSGLLAEALVRMDPEWRSVLSSKDYLFPNEWPAYAWVAHLASATLVVIGIAWRRRLRIDSPNELPIALGCLALFAGFLITLPVVASGIALFVQMQISRALWPVETLATLYIVWMMSEGSRSTHSDGSRRAGHTARARTVLVIIALATVGRGVYVAGMEHPDRALLQISLPRTPWVEVMRWARDNTTRTAYFLADPGHAWKYAISFRVGALRDVYLEEVKDAAMAMYSRASAERVRQRMQALGSFAELTPQRVQDLVTRFGVTHLVREKTAAGADACLGYPVVWQNAGFVVCDLAQ